MTIRLTKLLNEVKENRIYATGLGITVEKVCAFLSDEPKVKMLAALTRFQEAATAINNTPYGLFTSESVDAQIHMLGCHIRSLRDQLTELAKTHTKKEELDAINCAVRAVTEVLDY